MTMPSTVTTDRVVHVRVKNDLLDELRRAARREGNGISAVIRRLVKRGLAADARHETHLHQQ